MSVARQNVGKVRRFWDPVLGDWAGKALFLLAKGDI
jgi:hypothetical protein